MWSIGCILFQILYFSVLFYGNDINDQLNTIFKVFGIPYDTEIENINPVSDSSQSVHNIIDLNKNLSDDQHINLWPGVTKLPIFINLNLYLRQLNILL